jgi:hypothetical protein
VSITPQSLKRKRDIVEIHSTNQMVPSAVAPYPSLSPRAGQQLSMDMFDAASVIQPSTVSWTNRSTTGIVIDQLEAYPSPYYYDYRA